MFEDLKNIRIRDIIVTDDIFLICVFLIIPFGLLLLLFTYMYNKVYIKNNKRDFLFFFFVERGEEAFVRVGLHLSVFAYWFFFFYRELEKSFLELEEIWL